MEKDEDGSCVTSRSVTHFTSGANNPHHFQRMLCGRSESALSQPRLYHFKSLALELFVYRLHNIDYTTKIKDWRLKYGTHSSNRNSAYRFLCSRLSSSGSDFNSAQRLKKKRCACVAVSITAVSNPPLPHLPP